VIWRKIFLILPIVRQSQKIFSDAPLFIGYQYLSALIKRPHSVLAQKIRQMPRDAFCTSVIVACKLRYGIEKKASESLAAKVELLLNEIDILPLEYEAVSQHYAMNNRKFNRRNQLGNPIK
jgi:predicted nucleic acid-binding protein